MKIDLANLTIEKAHASLVAGEYTVRELATAYLKEIEKKNKNLNVYLEVFDDVLDQADRAQKLVARENLLAGIPVAFKDNMLLEGKRASAGSRILDGYVAPYDATAIKKLKDAGVVFLGRLNMDEFAMGASTENSAFGVTKNPHDHSRVAGGSSGGSAAAVASNMALATLGSDTGGSIRQPAAYCGVVGLKPTYGSISRHGLIAMGSSLDIIGPLTRSVSDAEILFNAMRGIDRYDSTSTDGKNSKSEIRKSKPTIGVPWDFVKSEGVAPHIVKSFESSIEKLKKLGYEVCDIKIPHIQYALAVYYIIVPAEVSTNLSRFDGVKYGLHVEGETLLGDYLSSRTAGFGAEARRRIMLGAYVLSSGYYDAYYNKANAVRECLKQDFAKAFQKVDLIMTPTTADVAFPIGKKSSDPLAMYLEDIFTVTANLVGVPAISLPAGEKEIDNVRLPIGIQFIANHDREDMLFTIGRDFMGE